MRINKFKVLDWLLVLAYFAIVPLGIKTFSVWHQIIELEGSSINVSHPHMARYIVMLPVLIVSQVIKVNADVVFSYVVITLMCTTSYLLAKLLSAVLSGSYVNIPRLFPLTLLPLAALSLAMNGRIALAMLGIVWIASAQIGDAAGLNRSKFGYGCSQVLGVMLASVSSGTVVIAFICVGAYNVIGPLLQWPKLPRASLARVGLGLLVALIAVPIVAAGVKKNLDFFGGDDNAMIRILHHGLGNYLPTVPIVAISLAIAFVLVGLTGWLFVLDKLISRGVRAPMVLASVLALMGGMFGISTLVSCTPMLYAMVLQNALRDKMRPMEVVNLRART